MMKTAIKIGIPPRTKALLIERKPCTTKDGSWLLWINANHDFTQGTFLRMYDNGMMERVTVYEDGNERVSIIKPEDE